MGSLSMDVIGFGTINMDEFIVVKRFSTGEKVLVEDRTFLPSGSAPNTIVGLSRLGMKTGLAGSLGTDDAGKQIHGHLRRERIDLHGVISKTGNTGRAFCIVDETGKRTVYIDPGVNDLIALSDLDIEWIKESGFLHLSSFPCLHSDQSFETQKKLIGLVDTRISFHIGYIDALRGLDRLKSILQRTEILFLSSKELIMLTKEKAIENACDRMLGEGVSMVAVTLGEKGCFVTDGGKSYLIPGNKVKAVNTTGAGDAFAAGFLYGHLKKKSLKECGSIGNIIARKTIQHLGVQSGLPEINDLS
jgi:ribokinase